MNKISLLSLGFAKNADEWEERKETKKVEKAEHMAKTDGHIVQKPMVTTTYSEKSGKPMTPGEVKKDEFGVDYTKLIKKIAPKL